jgi:hypothetical protein
VSTFNELPVHVLLVHFIVVLAPLTALLARRPTSRRFAPWAGWTAT